MISAPIGGPVAAPLSAAAGAVAAAWSPAALFAAGEAGTWYDPANLGAMFQTQAGAAVAAAGNPVALMLDESRGNLLSAVGQITNGGFDADIGGWTNAGGGTLAWSAGALRVTVTGSAAFAAQSVGGASPGGKWYQISGRARVISGGGNAQAYLYDGTTSYGATAAITSAAWTPFANWVYLPAGVTSAVIRLRAGVASAVVEFDDVWVSLIPGNHASQFGATTARPLYQTGPRRLVFDGADDAHTVNFPVALGSACTIARAVPGGAASIVTEQTIGTSYSITQSHAGLVILNRALTAGETAALTAWLNARGAGA